MYGLTKNYKYKLRLRLSLFLCLSLLFAFWAASYFENKQIQENEAHLAKNVALSLSELSREIAQSLDVYSLALNHLRSFIYSAKLDNLSHSLFRDYATYNDFQKNYPGARGFGFIRHVEAQDLVSFLESASQDRDEKFNISFLSDHINSRFIIQYIEPENKNQQAIGLDIGSEINRRNAALTAAHQNAPTLTAPITLVQENSKAKHGFLLLLPVFEGDGLINKEDISSVLGWVYAPLLIDEMLLAIQQKKSNLHLSISDVTAANNVEFFHGKVDQKNLSMGKSSRTARINLFGRVWEVTASPKALFINSLSLASPTKIYYQVLSTLILIALFLSNIFYLLHRRFLSLSQKSELAAVVENGIEGTIGLDEQFCLKYWNDSAKELFGFNAASLGAPFLDWLIGAYSADYLIDLFKRVSQGSSVKHFDVKLNASDSSSGDDKYLSLNFQPILQEGLFLGANVSMVDLSEVRSLQNLLEEKNQLLSIKLDHQDDKLKQSTSLHDSLLQGADFLIITTDLQGLITSTNRKLEEVLEYTQEEMLGEPITRVLEPKYLSSLNSNIFLTFQYVSRNLFDCLVYPLKHQSRVVSESLFIHKGGNQVELQLTTSAITDVDGNVLGYLFIADDIRLQKALKFDLELVNSAIHNSEDILLWLDERGAVCNSNPFARTALEYSEYELKRLNISDILPSDFHDSWQSQLAALQTASSITTEKRVNSRSGKEIPCLITLSKFTISGDAFLFLSAKDISDRLTKERALEEALNLAAQANLSKDQFLANMGHELRTPLNEVNGSLQLMQLTDLSSVQVDYLSQAKKSVRSLTQSIDDVLDCSEIIRNKLTLYEEQVDLLDVFNSVGQSSSIIAEDKNIEVHFDLADDVPHFIRSDAHRLYQLLMCLINNAVKFTFEGDIILRCTLLNELSNQYELGFEVIDSGVGISEEKQTEIFELFSQAEMGADRSFGGLGLGLTITKTIIELMSGHISCKSDVGMGTTFSFTIFVGKVDKQSSQDTVLQEVPSLKILVVDDNEISLSVLSRLIEQLGWQVTTATGAAAAVLKLEEALSNDDGFDLALIDWNMPEKSGLDLVKDIRKQFNPKDMPILVMVTAYTRKMLSQLDNRGVESLLSAFLTKPVTRTMLVDLVKSVLGPDRQELGVLGSRQLKLAGFRVLLVEDNQTNQFIAKNLLQSQGAIVTVASEGEEAWQILNEQPGRFDIVLMDIQMPGWDGYRATKEIREDGRFNDLPILAMTANVLASDKRKCFDVGMNGHIGKPFELTQLVQEILSLARKPKLLLRHRIATKKALRSESGDDSNIMFSTVESSVLVLLKDKLGVDIEGSLKRFSGSEELYIQSLNLFVKDLENYTQALTDLDNELTFEVVKPIFHTLKGTSGLLGFKDLANLAMECDQLASMLVAKGIQVEPLASLIQMMCNMKSLIEEIFEQNYDAHRVTGEEKITRLDAAKLQKLREQLKKSNMKAVELYAALQEDISIISPDSASMLEGYISKLDFKSALGLLDKLEQQYSEFIND